MAVPRNSDRTRIRNEFPHVLHSVEVSCDSDGRIGTTKTAPVSAETLNQGLTELPKEEASAVTDISNTHRQKIAADYLTRARADLDNARRVRLHYIGIARDNGMTFSSIGAALGVTEAAVRQMLKRHGGDN